MVAVAEAVGWRTAVPAAEDCRHSSITIIPTCSSTALIFITNSSNNSIARPRVGITITITTVTVTTTREITKEFGATT